jgi:hypothetical protein
MDAPIKKLTVAERCITCATFARHDDLPWCSLCAEAHYMPIEQLKVDPRYMCLEGGGWLPKECFNA